MKTKDRIRQIYKELELSQRKFAASIGLRETGLTSTLSGRSSTSKLLANSVELKHGYSAEWILTGKGKKFSDRITQAQRYNNMLAGAAKAWFGQFNLEIFAEKGVIGRITREIEQKQRLYIGRQQNSGKQKEDEVFSEIGKKVQELIEYKKKLTKHLVNESKKLNKEEYIMLIFKIYLEVIDKFPEDVDTEDFFISKSSYAQKIVPASKKIIRLIRKMYKLWEV